MWRSHSKMQKENSHNCLISWEKLFFSGLVTGRSACNCEVGVGF